MTMLATIRKLKTNPGSISLEDAAKAFRVEAEAMASSPREAEILATAALLNHLTSTNPEWVTEPLGGIRNGRGGGTPPSAGTIHARDAGGQAIPCPRRRRVRSGSADGDENGVQTNPRHHECRFPG